MRATVIRLNRSQYYRGIVTLNGRIVGATVCGFPSREDAAKAAAELLKRLNG